MGDYWWIGQFNLILLTGFFTGRVCNETRKEHWFNSLPEGYYRYEFRTSKLINPEIQFNANLYFFRKINVEGMSRDYKTKMKYFESEPEELKKRYAAIGVHNYEYKSKFKVLILNF